MILLGMILLDAISPERPRDSSAGHL